MLNKKSSFIPGILMLCLSWLLASCAKHTQSLENDRPTFRIPVVVQEPTKDTIEFIKAYALRPSYFRFVGKYKFTDTLKLKDNERQDTVFVNDYIIGYSHLKEDDTLNTDGFQIFVDYQTSLHYKHHYQAKSNYYFPIYIVNETSRTKLFIMKDNYIFGVQEANDTTGYDIFYPIEHRGFDFCGNGYMGILIKPGEFVLGLVPKYEGKEKQRMRIRLKIGEYVYISQDYQGTFNREQFRIMKSTQAENIRQNHQSSAIDSYFYGAIPKGYKERDVN